MFDDRDEWSTSQTLIEVCIMREMDGLSELLMEHLTLFGFIGFYLFVINTMGGWGEQEGFGNKQLNQSLQTISDARV